jgi:hypothetical protein
MYLPIVRELLAALCWLCVIIGVLLFLTVPELSTYASRRPMPPPGFWIVLPLSLFQQLQGFLFLT